MSLKITLEKVKDIKIKCRRCGKKKLPEEFGYNRYKKNHRDSYCIQCKKEYNKEYHRIKKDIDKKVRKRKYGF